MWQFRYFNTVFYMKFIIVETVYFNFLATENKFIGIITTGIISGGVGFFFIFNFTGNYSLYTALNIPPLIIEIQYNNTDSY